MCMCVCVKCLVNEFVFFKWNVVFSDSKGWFFILVGVCHVVILTK